MLVASARGLWLVIAEEHIDAAGQQLFGGLRVQADPEHGAPAQREEPRTPELHVLLTGLVPGESPRWHDGRLWFSDFGAHEVIAVDLEGRGQVIARVPGMPMGLGFLPDGRLLAVSARDGWLLAAGRGRRGRR